VPREWLRVRFDDRSDAGRRLAARLAARFPDAASRADLVVLALPRGGVPVGYEVAVALHVPLDVILVRKIGLPSQPELAMGAIGEDGVRVVNDDVVGYAHVDAFSFAEVEAREREELEHRAQLFRGSRTRLSLVGRTAIIVDDGIATGSTARAACQVASAEGATRVILATPVAPAPTVARLRDAADEVIVLDRPASFRAIGESYRDFTQLDDQEVVRLLARVGS
jgi:putative phosphoribosyl transferase